MGHNHSPAFDEGFLQVSSLHKLHYEQYGKLDGKPGMLQCNLFSFHKSNRPVVVFLHGGPGGSTSHANTIYFNPTIYRVVLFDQRGAGRSTPSAEIQDNTTQRLISDIEALRTHLKIPKWHLVFGGSWGSALALLYAQSHPQIVGSLVLRGIFTAREAELGWSRGPAGAARIYPDAYQNFISFLLEHERETPLQGYYKILSSSDHAAKLAAAREWNRWDLTIGSLTPDQRSFEKLNDEQWLLSHAILEAHYFANRGWIEEGQILRRENIDNIRHIPSKYSYR
jgi:proline iminopeptidase